MMPILKLIPASSAHYLRIFEKELADMAVAEESKMLMQSARSKHPRLSI
jgi:hypothetical protein